MAKKLKTHGPRSGASTFKAAAKHPQPGRMQTGAGGCDLASDPDSKSYYMQHLRRIEGQIRGVQKMVERDRYCADIMIQMAALQKSLLRVSMKLWQNHLNHCVIHASRGGGAHVDAACEELLQLSRMMMRE
ncbi:MAG: metal-sensitive transcriptional regulator [Phycisphaerae bacterium]